MIFQSNQKAELLVEAAQFRLSYSKLKEGKDLLRKRAQGYVINSDFGNYMFYSPRVTEFFTISSFNDSIKQNIFTIYYFNTLLSEYKISFENLIERLKSFNSKTESDIKYLNSVLKKQKIKTINNFSKVYLLDNFKDSNTKNSFHLKDFKTNTSLSKTNIVDSNNESLNINKIKQTQLFPEFVSVVSEETCFGDSKEPLVLNDIENILEEKDPFRFVIYKKIEDVLGYQYIVDKSYLTIAFDFNRLTRINNLKIVYASSKKILLEGNAIKYFNNAENQWNDLIFSELLTNNNSDLYFETILTDKIKITFTQFQHLEEKQIEDFVAKIFDLSIDCVSFYYSTYRNMSLFRSNEYLSLNQPLSLTYDVQYLYEDKDVFVERYLNIILYGEESFDAFKEKSLLKDDLNRETPRFNEVIPVPATSLIQKELLVFSLGTAKIQFVPNELSIKIYKNDETIPLIYGIDYLLSRDQKNSFLLESDLKEEVTLNLRYAGNWYIKLLNNSNSVEDLRTQFLNSYRIEYETSPLYFLNKDITCLYNKIVFSPRLQHSIGFTKPYLIFRTKKNNNESSSIIKQLLIKCEERETLKENKLEIEEFVELIAKGI